MIVITNNENNANNTAVMRTLAQLNTVYVMTSGLNWSNHRKLAHLSSQ